MRDLLGYKMSKRRGIIMENNGRYCAEVEHSAFHLVA